ncbi:EscU/YscU/HrcU family type III secretion system export apparatus switch protein [Anaeromyxobacter dehalogenans]|uniref:Type III secretion exporter n=1 Tax=Anaeromyxobacter dehalogenans (strain 2CP-C) TaxID=290397 RepID=Q2IQP7_ANADE|nr:EscU/YscU/HrcU family type III secretion system export apparatus switch protein [Anaeromyxobacter dehalogenans]ABC81133.1 type III secretion exporter [Anaeromyxobacter dehalogenans 2CP-C]
MADAEDQENRTEPASAQRLARARDEGQVPLGHDAALAAGLAGAALTLVAQARGLGGGLAELMRHAAGSVDRAPFATLPALAARPAAAALSVCAAAALAGAAATLAQTRGGCWPRLAAPDPSRLLQPGRLLRPLSRDFLLDLALALAKVGAIGAAAWSAARDGVARLPALLGAAPGEQLALVFSLVARVALPVLLAAAALALAELGLARWRFARKHRMTKDEAKREVKEDEGDPLVRGRRRRRHRELLRNQARLEVPRADALVVNPTHVAVALRYRRDEGRAPRVTAKGKGELARQMRALAREHGVPVVQDVPLARLLYRKVKVGREIPAQTYKAVAAVLAFVYRAAGRRDGGARA